jgi:hypothetical protein
MPHRPAGKPGKPMTIGRGNMKILRQQIVRAVISILFTTPLWVSAGAALAQGPSQSGQPATLKQRLVRPKPARTILNPAKVRTDVIVVKFREGTRVKRYRWR